MLKGSIARLIGIERLQRSQIGRRGDEGRVAGRKKELAEQVETLLRSGGYDDVLDTAAHASSRHVARYPGTEGLVTFADRVLQRLPSKVWI
jgi:hypothetical protein